jgi:hypothetical protein
VGYGGRRVIEANFIARPYRGVSVQDAPSLESGALLAHVRSRRVYRRTEFIVAVHGDDRALVQLERAAGDGILVGVRDAWVLATADQVAFVVDHAVDTGNASQLARAARASGEDALVYVVEGRYQHVNFIYAPAPVRVRVLEVVPPEPPKLLDMAQTVIEYDEDLPPLELDFVPIDLRDLAAAHPAGHYLFPCRCAGLDLDATVDFLDAGPPRPADWTLIGCERSRQIHAALYGHDPHARVDFCPLLHDNGEPDVLTLRKCCLRERGIEREGTRMTVPWGANLEEVRAALRSLAGVAA